MLLRRLKDKNSSTLSKGTTIPRYEDGNPGPAGLTPMPTSIEDEMVVDSCGESLARIWVSRNKINMDLIKKLSKTAFDAAKLHIQGNKPEWLIYFEE